MNCTAPAIPAGPGSVIVGGADITLTADQAGAWSITSGNSFATLNGATSTTVNLHGIVPGTATITFTPDCGGVAQAVTKDVLVNCTSPAIPAGPSSVTVGSADITLTADQAGTWAITSGNSFATLNGATSTTVNVHGMAPGTVTITFTPDCGGVAQVVNKNITVNCTAPVVPTGPGSVTVGGADITLTADQAGTWSIASGNSFATLNGATSTTVNLHGIAPGTATITFTPDCGGVAQAVTKDVLVNCTSPAIPAGPGSVTVGSADITLTADQAGTWSITSGNSFATLNNATSTTVNVHGVAAGSSTITFTPTCGGVAQAVTKDVLVNCTAPAIPAGSNSVTVGGTDITLTADQTGTWAITSGNSFATLNNATSTTVNVHGISAGTSTITFTPTCGGAAQLVTKDITVNCAAPGIPAGPTSVTVGNADITLTADQAGTWSIISGSSFATLNSATATTVNVHGIAAGTTTVTFTPTCGGAAQAVNKNINVSITCTIPSIPSGPGSVTIGGADATLTADQPGTWAITSGNGFANLNGVTATTVDVHGIASGTVTVTFTPTCGGASQSVNKNIVVNCTAPTIPVGPGSVTVGSADITLTADQAGVWSVTSGNSYATLNNATSTTVMVHGIAPGTATVAFTPDCGGAVQAVIRDVLVNCTAPAIPAGPTSVTVGNDIMLTADQAGVWAITSGNSLATLNAATSTTVNVHAVSAGGVTISFIPDCGGAVQTVTKDIIINAAVPACALSPAFNTAPATVIVGATALIAANQPGLWSSSTVSASISPVTAVSSSATVTGVSAGSTTISFAPSDAACAIITQVVTVDPVSTERTRLVVFPNPVVGQLTIKADADELKTVKIFSPNGQDLTKMVRKISDVNNAVVLDVSKLPPGTYNIKTATSITKVIKQ